MKIIKKRMKGLRRPTIVHAPVDNDRLAAVEARDRPANERHGDGWRAQLITPRPAEWYRPKTPLNYVRYDGELTFMHMDTTYSVGTNHAIIEIHGVTREGYSVWVNVHGFLPNFFIRLDKDQNPDRIRDELEQRLQRKFFANDFCGKRKQYIEKWERCDNVRSIMCYRVTNPFVYYQVHMNNPKQVAAAREFMSRGTAGKHHSLRVEETFEANVRYDLRYMVDHGLHGCQWVTFRNVRIPTHDKRTSRAQVEVYVNADDTVPLQGKVI